MSLCLSLQGLSWVLQCEIFPQIVYDMCLCAHTVLMPGSRGLQTKHIWRALFLQESPTLPCNGSSCHSLLTWGESDVTTLRGPFQSSGASAAPQGYWTLLPALRRRFHVILLALARLQRKSWIKTLRFEKLSQINVPVIVARWQDGKHISSSHSQFFWS